MKSRRFGCLVHVHRVLHLRNVGFLFAVSSCWTAQSFGRTILRRRQTRSTASEFWHEPLALARVSAAESIACQNARSLASLFSGAQLLLQCLNALVLFFKLGNQTSIICKPTGPPLPKVTILPFLACILSRILRSRI